ncbi:MAG TPA: right-handed parallel beta-helix repeat-containing protein, partial [Chitinophagales bacterium]|nr:right-handed parallel beta-helix repeat-containing protein [Chitinophagales bacterium]
MENLSTFLSLIIRQTLFPIFKIIAIVSLQFIGNLSAQSIIYVDSSKTSSGVGTSWSTAYKTLKEATITANNNTSIKEIRIAKGTYFPTTNTNRDSTFLISRGDIRIYGGYPSGGGTRNYATNPTILSGDIGTFGTQTDNSYHVMVIAGLAASADSVVVDGISVQWGRASGSGSFTYNGNSIKRNTGGGIFAYNNANGNKTTIRNCTISANYASDAGAGMCNTGSATLIVNCLFSGNYANYGGAMINGSSPVNIINCTIAGNHDNNGGGGMRNSSSVPTITNTIIYGNNGGISNNSSTPVITYSLVQGLTATTNGNLNGNTTNPLFVTPVEAGTTNTGGDYKLQNGSPCVNVGSNVAIPSGVDTDINGNNRLHCTTDMGAHELQVITWFVKPTVSGNGSGSSWSNASDDLQLTIENACANDEIWVAAGTYKPMRPANNLNTINVNNRDNAFVIKADVKIYGGFPATGTPILADRNWATNITTLSGDIGTVGYAGDNAFHVIISVGDVGRAVLDGFKVIAGKADGDGTIKVNSINLYRLYGGGMQNAASSPTIINCTFSDNFSGYMSGGGGMCNFSSSPILTNCSFSGNQTLLDGGGMYNFSSSPILTNCSFKANRAEYNGGGMYNSYSSPVLVNCSFSGNQADIRGGGMCNLNSSAPELSNCIFSGNRAFPFGGGMYNLSSSPLLTNCIVWGNSNQWGDISEILGDATVIYSIVRGGYTGTGNLDSDPIFENAPSYTTAPFTNGDYRLQACSPAINAGSNAVIPSNITIDLDGNPRIYNSGIVDMGAYEAQG